MNNIYDINRIRILNMKSGRSPMSKIIPCQWCGIAMECGHKKVRVKGVSWKQWVPARQYCSSQPCAKQSLNFKVRLTKKLLNPTSQDEYLSANYCLMKMLTRSPIEFLSPILTNCFEHARPKEQKIEVKIKSNKRRNN